MTKMVNFPHAVHYFQCHILTGFHAQFLYCLNPKYQASAWPSSVVVQMSLFGLRLYIAVNNFSAILGWLPEFNQY